MDFKLTVDGTDVDLSTGDYVLVDGVDAVRQSLLIGLQFFLGEWFLDQRVGIPYFEKILGQKPRENIVRSIFRDAILKTPGVASLSSLIVDFDGTTRRLDVSFRAKTVDGEIVDFDEELILP